MTMIQTLESSGYPASVLAKPRTHVAGEARVAGGGAPAAAGRRRGAGGRAGGGPCRGGRGRGRGRARGAAGGPRARGGRRARRGGRGGRGARGGCRRAGGRRGRAAASAAAGGGRSRRGRGRVRGAEAQSSSTLRSEEQSALVLQPLLEAALLHAASARKEAKRRPWRTCARHRSGSWRRTKRAHNGSDPRSDASQRRPRKRHPAHRLVRGAGRPHRRRKSASVTSPAPLPALHLARTSGGS